MEPEVHLCCESKCGKVASAFGIRGTAKECCCGTHMALLAARAMTICDITGYSFVQSADDVEEFLRRKSLADRGCSNLLAIEYNCDIQFYEAETTLKSHKHAAVEVVENCFQELESMLTSCHAELKEQFEALRLHLAQYTAVRELKLHEAAQLACGTLRGDSVGPALTMSDCSAAVRKAVFLTCNFYLSSVDKVLDRFVSPSPRPQAHTEAAAGQCQVCQSPVAGRHSLCRNKCLCFACELRSLYFDVKTTSTCPHCGLTWEKEVTTVMMCSRCKKPSAVCDFYCWCTACGIRYCERCAKHNRANVVKCSAMENSHQFSERKAHRLMREGGKECF